MPSAFVLVQQPSPRVTRVGDYQIPILSLDLAIQEEHNPLSSR